MKLLRYGSLTYGIQSGGNSGIRTRDLQRDKLASWTN